MSEIFAKLIMHNAKIQWFFILALIIIAIIQLASNYVTADVLKTYRYVSVTDMETRIGVLDKKLSPVVPVVPVVPL
jgi:hypothetical protein